MTRSRPTPIEGRDETSLDRRADERGFALLIVIVVIFLVSTMLLLLAHAISIAQRDLREEERRVEAAALLDAALSQTLDGFEANAAFGGFAEHPLGHGTIACALAGPASPPDHEVEITVTRLGWSQKWRAVVRVGDPDGPHLISVAPMTLLGPD